MRGLAPLTGARQTDAKKDQVGLVLFGSGGSSNALWDEEEAAARENGSASYAHVSERVPVQLPDMQFLRDVLALQPGGGDPEGAADADLVDALIVAFDMLHRATLKKNNVDRKILLVTNGKCPAVDTEDLPVIEARMGEMGVDLQIVGVGFDETADYNTAGVEVVAADAELGRELSKRRRLLTEMGARLGLFVPVKTLAGTTIMSHKEVRQMSKFRGALAISQQLTIPVWVFARTKEATLPSLKKVSLEAKEKTGRAGRIATERTYTSLTAKDTQLDSELRTKGYRYGKQRIPMSKVDEAALKLETERELVCLGFSARAKLQRHHLIDCTDILIADPTLNGEAAERAGQALAALARAMHEEDVVMYARFVKRKNANPALIAIYADAEEADDDGDYSEAAPMRLLASYLPFAEDLREITFPSLEGAKRSSWQPGAEQLAAADSVIDALTLAEPYSSETLNPGVQRFHQVMQARALEPDCPIPEIDSNLKALYAPQPEMFEAAAAPLMKLQGLFSLELQDAAAAKRGWDSMALKGNQGRDPDSSASGKRARTADDAGSASAPARRGISTSNPIRDFTELYRTEPEIAVKGMAAAIKSLVDSSVKGHLYKKAIQCLRQMKLECKRDDDPEHFNTQLRHLKELYMDSERDDFWQQLRESAVSLLHTGDTQYSNVSAAVADEFLKASASATVAATAEEDNLLDLF